jgi:hypothetical protein
MWKRHRSDSAAAAAFFCGDVGLTVIDQEVASFDLVLATGVLHHLDNDHAIGLFNLARAPLREARLCATGERDRNALIARLLFHVFSQPIVMVEPAQTSLPFRLWTRTQSSPFWNALIAYPYCRSMR